MRKCSPICYTSIDMALLNAFSFEEYTRKGNENIKHLKWTGLDERSYWEDNYNVKLCIIKMRTKKVPRFAMVTLWRYVLYIGISLSGQMGEDPTRQRTMLEKEEKKLNKTLKCRIWSQRQIKDQLYTLKNELRCLMSRFKYMEMFSTSRNKDASCFH